MSDMSNIDQAKEVFFESIRNSDIYIRFEKARKSIEGQEEKKAIIDAFRENAYQLTNTAEPLDHTDELQELFTTRHRIRKDPLIDEYLTAELEYCRMIQRICMELLMLSDVQIESFEDRILVK